MFNCDKPDKETFFVDLDGTLCKFNRDPENVPDEMIDSVWHFVLDQYRKGNYIVITTARSKAHMKYFFRWTGIDSKMFHAIITDLPRLCRTVINDHVMGGDPLAAAINLVRNEGLRSMS